MGSYLYHCGPKGLPTLDWTRSPGRVGTIGPGIYFTPFLEKARDYCRKGYSIYEVELKTFQGLLQYRDLASEHPSLWEALRDVVHENKERWDVATALGALVEKLGPSVFVREMKPLRISGTIGVFRSDTEFAIFDSSLYRIREEKDPLTVRVASRFTSRTRRG